MSALIYIYTTNEIIISADTLSVDMNKQPLLYVTKILPVPHLKTVICGTGFKPLISKWFNCAMENIIGFDITSLNHHAPGKLQSILQEIKEPVQGTTTIYHFGFSENDQMLKGYAFRSVDNFVKEELETDNIGIKPSHPGIAEFYQKTLAIHPLNTDAFHIEVIKQLKRLDTALPISERVGIGGEIQLLRLSGKGNISMATIFQFSDFIATYKKMLMKSG
jgi:hypothetical protein